MTTYGERFNDPEELTRHQQFALQARIYTMLPGHVVSVQGRTATVQPAVLAKHVDILGNVTYKPYPVIPNVPLLMPGGGGMHLTFPVQPGDEVELRFASRNIDGFFQAGSATPPLDASMHNLSDCIATPAALSQGGGAAAGAVGTAFVLGKADGTLTVSLDPSTNKATMVAGGCEISLDASANAIAINAESQVNMLSTDITLTGTVNVVGVLKVNGVVVNVP